MVLNGIELAQLSEAEPLTSTNCHCFRDWKAAQKMIILRQQIVWKYQLVYKWSFSTLHVFWSPKSSTIKSATPRALTAARMSWGVLGCIYRNNQRCWMVTTIMKHWLVAFDRHVARQFYYLWTNLAPMRSQWDYWARSHLSLTLKFFFCRPIPPQRRNRWIKVLHELSSASIASSRWSTLSRKMIKSVIQSKLSIL